MGQSLLYHEIRTLYKDPLTKLLNRNALLEEINKREESLIVLLDIDKFTEVNYLYGEYTASRILIEYAKKLNECFGNEATIYREGADSFVLLYSDVNKDIEHITNDITDFINNLEDDGVLIDDISIYILTSAIIVKNKNNTLKYAKKGMIESKKNYSKIKVYQYQDKNEKSYQDNIKWVKRVKKARNSHRFNHFFRQY